MNNKRSSVHLRTLSRLGVDLEQVVENLEVASTIQGSSEVQDVTGLSGRMRLQKAPTVKNSGNWMDKQRQYLQAYEYLCHIGEAKEWIESCLSQAIPAVIDLEEQLRNGVVLARLAKVFVPALVPRIFEAPKLQFRHSDNINRFFKFVDHVDLPQNFRFELTDLYEKKNVPKVIYCIHALSFVLANAGLAARIGDLVGKLQFTEDELRQTQRSLDAGGISLPNFKNVGTALSGETESAAVAAETQEERQARLLMESLGDIEAVQAHARGTLLRRRISSELNRLDVLEDRLILLQSAARGFLVRQQYFENAHTYRQINDWITNVQIRAQGFLIRKRLDFRNTALCLNSAPMARLQAISRGYLKRKETLAQLEVIRGASSLEKVMILQSILRGNKLRNEIKLLHDQWRKHDRSIVDLQAQCRRALSRRRVKALEDALSDEQLHVCALQVLCRGYLVRTHQARLSQSIGKARNDFERFGALAQGYLMRKRYEMVVSLLVYEEDSIIETQALSRGLLLRHEYNDKLIALTQAEWSIVHLQVYARGACQRIRYRARIQHYKKNMERVIKVQSFVRARQQGAAYKSLLLDKDPPISTIKNFVHLLNDSNFDFEEEVKMEQARKEVVQRIRENEAAEEHIEQMDIKIALLVKQAIKIDEVIQHQKRMDNGLGLLPHEGSAFDLKALNKQARSQLENYQKFFYIIQTQPVYLARLFRQMTLTGESVKDTKKLESLIMVLFGYAQKKREEYFLLRCIRASIINEISYCNGIADFLGKRYLWRNVLSSFLKGAKADNVTCALLQPLVARVIQDDFLDLESDPLKIYNSIRENEAMRTGQEPSRPAHVSQEYAIQDPDTRVTFIKHLRDLRDLTEQVINAVEVHVRHLPFGLRYIARETYRAMQEHLQTSDEHELLSLVGHLIFQEFITPALMSPVHHGLVSTPLAASSQRNLNEISRMLNQVAAARLFENGSYLQPLNEFIIRSIERITGIFESIIEVEELEQHYNTTELDDVVATKRPILYIKASDIFAMHSTISHNLHSIAPEFEDPLNQVLKDLGKPPSRAEDLMIMSITNTEIALTLDPKAIDVDDPEADERALFMQTKRYVLYIIRIQSGSNLLEILVEPVYEVDEMRWREVVQDEHIEEQRRSRNGHVEKPLQDISRLSYSMLKRMCLENIVTLERLGWISRADNYQELLNSIADDIRTQNRRRIERQHELQSTRGTLHDLDSKRRYLDGQLKSYNDYIEQAMLSLQNKKVKKRSILPFTKQYFHMRDLQKAGKVPKFGSRRYSASKLYDKGILVSVANEQPPYDKLDITISSDQIGLFNLKAYQHNSETAALSTSIQLDDLLQAQFNKAEIIDIFDGQVKIRVSMMLNLVFKHFFSQ